ncbi:MAG: DegT/DnrJ/EryC1/StrS family aminotransferase, partial [Azonexus sp.]|nr:DegT/DnrJ/EryC1/StrS family aminotransferase [Azonexus sp.]
VIDTAYRAQLANVKGIHLLQGTGEKVANHAYFPIFVQPQYPLSRDELYQKLKDHGIHARRYFYPLISDFPMYRELASAQHGNLPVAAEAAARVLCLPIYPTLEHNDVQRIIDLVAGISR